MESTTSFSRAWMAQGSMYVSTDSSFDFLPFLPAPSRVVVRHDHDAVDATVLEGGLGNHNCVQLCCCCECGKGVYSSVSERGSEKAFEYRCMGGRMPLQSRDLTGAGRSLAGWRCDNMIINNWMGVRSHVRAIRSSRMSECSLTCCVRDVREDIWKLACEVSTYFHTLIYAPVVCRTGNHR